MLGMGITLSVDDFKRVLKMPRAVGIGFVAHYAIMPFLGWSIAHLLRLETPVCRRVDSGVVLPVRHGVECGQLHRAVECRAVGADDHVLDARRDRDDAAADEMARGPIRAGGRAGACS